MKVIAFYLPQFHEIEENNVWWGEGFTEWTNVKKTRPLFKKHNQPRIPLDNNYYKLDCEQTLVWQSELMNSYGVDGMCFYHYWFNGKQLLQKPLSILLNNKDIKMPFCLSWANEPWTRAWDGGDKEILMPQEYGNIKDWGLHFDYLITAFQDDRYILVDGKPLLIIYRPGSIPCFDEMIEFWRKRCQERGFKGLHVVVSNTVFKDESRYTNYDAQLDFEPMCTIGQHFSSLDTFSRRFYSLTRFLFRYVRSLGKEKLFISTLDYDFLWKKIISRNFKENVYPGAFVDWDNSPRKGAKRSLVLEGYTVEKFGQYFSIQYQKGVDAGCPFIFVNAWNEWAEGTYLEPDITDGTAKLDKIKCAKSI